jgi:3-oxoacyl-[acyl-carrier protein] reductase
MSKKYLFIGGSYGIGNSLLKELDQNDEVWVASRSSEGVHGANIHHIPFDVLNGALPMDQLPTQLDGFVYCPGSINLRPFRGLKPEAFLSDFDINVMGAVRTLQQVQPLLAASEQASVVLFSTVAVQTGMPFHSSVAASKGALEGLGRSLAAEWAPKIRVNIIAPSITDTPLANRFLNNEAKKEKAALRHPLKRVGTTEDVAQLAAFLLSEKSSWITGQVMGIDGGMSAVNVQG